MQNTEFHKNLSNYIRNNDNANANRVVMSELGNILVKSKQDFVDLLTYSGIPAEITNSDVVLVNKFIDNIHQNKRLLIGSAFLVNQHNKTMGFDGDYEVSDLGVKGTAQVMHFFFDAGAYPDNSTGDDFYGAGGEEYSYVGWADAIKGIADVGGGITGKVMESRGKKKFGALDLATKKTDEKNQMVSQIMAQKQAEIEAKKQAQEQKAKTTKITLIVVGSVIVVGLIATLLIMNRKKKQA